jgi:hypothetical protein
LKAFLEIVYCKAEQTSKQLLVKVNAMVIAKTLELIDSSQNGRYTAVQNVVTDVIKTLKNIKGVDIMCCTFIVEESKIVGHNADVNTYFMIERLKLMFT